MSKKSIELLKKNHENFDLNVEVTSSGKDGAFAVKSFLTLFTGENPPKVIRKATAIAIASDINKAQDEAIDLVVNRIVSNKTKE